MGLNNRTVMSSNGSQYMCTIGPITTVGPSWAMSVVAERTGNTSAITSALNSNGGGNGAIGWAASANTARLDPGDTGNTATASASDNAWHSLIGQINLTSTNGDTSLQIDNGTAVASVGNGGYDYDGTYNALFSESYGTNCGTADRVMTGDIAEAMILAIGGSGNAYTGHLSAAQITAVYNNQQAYYDLSGGTTTGNAYFAGNVGIGTTTPYSRLEVWGPTPPPPPPSPSSTALRRPCSRCLTAATQRYSGSIFQSSDQRLKTNIQSLDAPRRYRRSSAQPRHLQLVRLDQPGTGAKLGFIAQQVQPIFPQLVSTTSRDRAHARRHAHPQLQGLISPIISAIQALYADITSVETTIAGFAQSFVSRQHHCHTMNCVSVRRASISSNSPLFSPPPISPAVHRLRRQAAALPHPNRA